jgi:2-hydroxy-6-oxonona-2,4-dienedioate hydrolase
VAAVGRTVGRRHGYRTSAISLEPGTGDRDLDSPSERLSVFTNLFAAGKTVTKLSEEATSRFANVTEGSLKDFQIHYNEAGAGEGEVVVLLHGSGAGASSWANFGGNLDAFVNAGFRTLLVDLPGWSKSDPIVVETGARNVINAAAVKGVLDHLGIDKAHLVGNSMGGMTALQFAVSYPLRVTKLVTMGGGAGGPNILTPMPTEGLKRLNELYVEPTRENLQRMLDIFVHDPSRLSNELIEMRYENMLRRPDHLENFAKTARINPGHQAIPEVSSNLAGIKIQTLAVWGNGDRFVPLEAGMRLLAIPNSRLHIFNQCGHWAQWEHAEEFNRLVIDFLSDGPVKRLAETATV